MVVKCVRGRSTPIVVCFQGYRALHELMAYFQYGGSSRIISPLSEVQIVQLRLDSPERFLNGGLFVCDRSGEEATHLLFQIEVSDDVSILGETQRLVCTIPSTVKIPECVHITAKELEEKMAHALDERFALLSSGDISLSCLALSGDDGKYRVTALTDEGEPTLKVTKRAAS